jgi:hypothetical protein
MDLERPLVVALVASLVASEVVSGEAEGGVGSNGIMTAVRTNYGLENCCYLVQITSRVSL